MTRIIIAGGRNFNNYELLKDYCDTILIGPEKYTIISGKARGADALGERYAREKGYVIEEYPANWDMHGKSAGYKRNLEMANTADTLIVFWNEISKGTKHMIDIAKKYNLETHVKIYEE